MNNTQEFSIQTFNFENNNIRTIEIDNVIWFVAKDVAATLGYSNTADAITRHCRKAKSLIDMCAGFTHTPSDANNCNLDEKTKLILESDVYRITLKSNLPSAEKFQDWIVEEVLPSICHTGSYDIVPVNNQNQIQEILGKFLERESKFLELQSKASERESKYLELLSKFEEKVEYEKYKASISTAFEISNKIEFEKYVNIIKDLSNINIRANINEVTLKLYLHQNVKDHEKIFKSNGEPYEKYINNEFYTIDKSVNSKVYITKKGADHLYWFLKLKKIIN